MLSTYEKISSLSPDHAYTMTISDPVELIEVSASGRVKWELTDLQYNFEIRTGFVNHSSDSAVLIGTNPIVLSVINRDTASQDIYVRIVYKQNIIGS